MSPNYMNYRNYRNYMVTLSIHLIESILSTLFIITKKKNLLFSSAMILTSAMLFLKILLSVFHAKENP